MTAASCSSGGGRTILTLWPQRGDVIETPLDGLLDVNGWDVGKALRLIVKGNAVAIEWLRSPIVYRGDPVFRDSLLAFADAHAPLASIQRHYFHLGMQQLKRANETDGIAIKRLFYILRPAMALRWMRYHSDATPPMHFPTLVAESDPPAHIQEIIAGLIASKARTRELGHAPIPAEIESFFQAEYALAEAAPKILADERSHAAADAAFYEMLERFAPP